MKLKLSGKVMQTEPPMCSCFMPDIEPPTVKVFKHPDGTEQYYFQQVFGDCLRVQKYEVIP